MSKPLESDVLIQRGDRGNFTVGLLHGAAQIDCVDFENALYEAGRFAAHERGDLWYRSGTKDPSRLPDVCAVRRLWNEYVELPTLQLTREQVRRFLDADEATCEAVLAVLVDVRLLRRSDDGKYARAYGSRACIPPLRYLHRTLWNGAIALMASPCYIGLTLASE